MQLIKSFPFSKQNSKLRIHSKLDRNQLKLTVCSGSIFIIIIKVKKTVLSSIEKKSVIWTEPNCKGLAEKFAQTEGSVGSDSERKTIGKS